MSRSRFVNSRESRFPSTWRDINASIDAERLSPSGGPPDGGCRLQLQLELLSSPANRKHPTKERREQGKALPRLQHRRTRRLRASLAGREAASYEGRTSRAISRHQEFESALRVLPESSFEIARRQIVRLAQHLELIV